MSKDVIINKDYSDLLSQIAEIYKLGQHNATIAVNTTLVETYWHIGKYIVEFEQKGKQKAEYGKALIDNLSKDLSLTFGKGFSPSNLIYMRLFYSEFQISQKASNLLSWSHYVELLRISDKLERSFYLQQTITEKWSITQP
jgi:predicted nuclease of restriction endonuclease-like (RecB) superfamily